MEFFVIADEDTVIGFRYAGVDGTIVRSPADARRELDQLAGERRRAIVITTEQIANQVREKINQIRFGQDLPLVVEIPGPGGRSPESPSLLEMIREAVGIKF